MNKYAREASWVYDVINPLVYRYIPFMKEALNQNRVHEIATVKAFFADYMPDVIPICDDYCNERSRIEKEFRELDSLMANIAIEMRKYWVTLVSTGIITNEISQFIEKDITKTTYWTWHLHKYTKERWTTKLLLPDDKNTFYMRTESTVTYTQEEIDLRKPLEPVSNNARSFLGYLDLLLSDEKRGLLTEYHFPAAPVDWFWGSKFENDGKDEVTARG